MSTKTKKAPPSENHGVDLAFLLPAASCWHCLALHQVPTLTMNPTCINMNGIANAEILVAGCPIELWHASDSLFVR
jgi:hypothetical protein